MADLGLKGSILEGSREGTKFKIRIDNIYYKAYRLSLIIISYPKCVLLVCGKVREIGGNQGYAKL